MSQPVPPLRALSARFNEALAGAANLHAQQRRKGTDTPFVAHLLGVAAIALEFGATEDEAIAALLHDAIEDAPPELGPDWVRRWIRHRFGDAVLAVVEGCTDTDEHPKPSWRVRKERYVARLAEKPEGTILVSAADKLHNARAILADFRTSGDAVFSRFNRDAGKAGTIGYYRGLVEAYEARLQQPESPRTGRIRTLIRELDVAVSTLEQEAGLRGVWPLRI
ncbi:MAG TPA: HD domain-containing protein [Vicinamibacterales bacterium]|nr:HD domain-containing protein [Vicinamibacterales bacterium]